MATKTYSTLIKDGKVYAEVPLRDVVERCDVSDMPILSEIKRLYEENDRLRELGWDMLRWMPCHRPCSRCERYKYPNGCEFEQRMRKLGIEVDNDD